MKHPECPVCGSDQIMCDAYAHWDYINQSWELHSTYDGNYFCSDCEADISIVNWEEDNDED